MSQTTQINNEWNWERSWLNIKNWSWKPTSPTQLMEIETKILQSSGIKYKQEMIHVGNDRHINTIIVGSGPPLILLHGFAAGVGFWICNLKDLSSKYTVYALDLPGFGRSTRKSFIAKEEEEAEDFFISHIHKWVNEHNFNEKFIILGHSFGGYLAACYSLKHPEQIKRVILADPWGVPNKPKEDPFEKEIPLKWKVIGKLLSFFNPLAVVRAAGPYGPGLITKYRPDIPEKFSHLVENPELISNYIYHMNAQNPEGESAFQAMSIPFGWAKRPLVGRLTSLSPNVPITFLYGSNTWMDRACGYELAKNLGTRAEYKTIPNAGHHIYADNYSSFNQLILSYQN